MKSANGTRWGSRTSLFGFNGDDENAVGARGRSAKRARERMQQAKAESAPQVEPVKSATAPVAEAAILKPAQAQANLGDPNHVNIAKKKKKKKKKKEETTQVAYNVQSGERPDLSEKKDDSVFASNHAAGGGDVFGGSGSRPNQAPTFNENPETLEEWTAYIMREPSYERTMHLIQKQQVGELKAEIFHTVVEDMLADERPKMHEYAVLALGSTPSFKSFVLLQAAGLTMPDALKIQIRTYARSYSRLENLRYLAAVIGSDATVDASFEAMRLIQLSAQSYAGTTTSTGTTGGTNGSSGSGSNGGGTQTSNVRISAAVTRQFSTLVPILTRLAQTAQDASLRQEASQTLNRLKPIVGETVKPAA